MTVLLRVEGLTHSFRQPDGTSRVILDHLDLTLNRGEVVCLLGASGSGKTTLLRILAGLDTASGGRIDSALQRPGPRIGYLSQNDHLLPWRSALGNSALGLELTGWHKKAAQAKAREALAAVGLAAFADHAPWQLSGGMQQRVLLARLYALEADLLLLDEPMSNLDILARHDLSLLVRTYTRARKAATLVVTHSVEEACFLADRVLFLTRPPARILREILLPEGGNEAENLQRVTQALWQALEAT